MNDELFTQTASGPVMIVALALPDMLDSAEFDRLNDSLLALVSDDAHRRWVIDLSASHYMGSAVLGLLVNIRQRVKAGQGRLVLCGLGPRLMEIFHATSLVRLFTIVRAREEALRLAAR
jgi:anti-anti-sigma factor